MEFALRDATILAALLTDVHITLHGEICTRLILSEKPVVVFLAKHKPEAVINELFTYLLEQIPKRQL